jgi:hypothetical protein
LVGKLAMVALFAAVLAGSLLLPTLMPARSGRPVPAARRPPSPAPWATPRAGASAHGAGAVRPPADSSASEYGAGGVTSPQGVRAGLARRLDEILQVREQAYARRDATLLDTVYTVDCACLRSGRAAIARLLADHAVWRGRSMSVRVERLSRVNHSLWIALAVLRRGAFRIEREDGALIAAEPAACQRYRFALVRPGPGRWLLGHASLVQELPP